MMMLLYFMVFAGSVRYMYRWLYNIKSAVLKGPLAVSKTSVSVHQICCLIITRLHLCLFFHPGQALRSQLQRWCWSAWRPSPQMAPSSLCPSWPSGCRGPDRDCSSCCACVCTMVSSLWWTSTTARCWLTSLCPPPTAHASTSTAPCSALWARSLYSCLTPSGTRRISTPSVSSVWLWQLFPSWAFC